jgi:hypothetical protein
MHALTVHLNRIGNSKNAVFVNYLIFIIQSYDLKNLLTYICIYICIYRIH